MTSGHARVVLVGPPGSGKTAVAELVAKLLDVHIHETDDDVVAGTGLTVAEAFVEHGESWFRRRERAAAARLLSDRAPGVIVLGGGAVLDEATRADLAGQPVAYLAVGPAEAARRTGLVAARPVLALSPRGMLHALAAEREPLYAEVAALRVDTDAMLPAEVARRVASWVRGAP